MKKKIYIIASIVAILIAITSTTLFLKNKSVSYITVTTNFYTNRITNTTWTYQYTDKYDEAKHQWDYKNTDMYILRNGKWELAKANKSESADNVASVKVEKKSKGAYFIMAQGHSQNNKSGMFTFDDSFTVDCATSKITEGN